jgi:hypothetical protein
MNASSSIALLIAACGLLATATAKGDDAQGAQASGGSNASAQSTVASEAPVTESRRDASERPASTATAESNVQAPPASGAAERQAAPAAAAAPAATAQTPAGDSKPKADPLAANVIDEGQLGTARGGAELDPVPLTVNQNNTTGAVTGNVAANLTTGSNNISDSAFSNSAGVPVVIQNTGNNVLIQNSTIVNLQLTSPGK